MSKTLVAALNRPRLLAGIDKRLFAVCFLVSFLIGVANDQVTTRLIGGAVFVVCAVAAYRLTKWDPNMMAVIPLLLRQKTVYDPGRRSGFRAMFKG